MSNFIFSLSSNKAANRILTVLFIAGIVWFQFYGVKFHFDLSKNPLDLRLGYSSSDVNKYFAYLGEDGRSNYHYAMRLIDMLFPLIYGILIIFQIAYLVKKLFNSNVVLLYLLMLLPISMAAFDYCENFNTLTMLNDYPNIPDYLANKGSFFTKSKWELSLLTTLLTTVGYIRLARTRKK